MERSPQRRLRHLGRSALSALGGLIGGGRSEGGGADRSDRRVAVEQRTPFQDRTAAGPPTADPGSHRGTVATAEGRPHVSYAPTSDGEADPGEVVWAWVPYEDDPAQGKDRPVVVIGTLGDDVAALQLTSRAHDDRHHLAIGPGGWDSRRRPSWVKLDRVLRLDPDGIRREGVALDRARFDRVVAAWAAYGG